MYFTKADIGKTFVRDDGADVALVYVAKSGECVFESKSRGLITATYNTGYAIKSDLGVRPKRLKAFAVVVGGDVYSFGRDRAACAETARVIGGDVVELVPKETTE